MDGYIRRIRSLIGHETLVLCGASVIVENARGEILLIRRTDNGCWSTPGGIVEVDEPVEDAARRELREETGLEAEALSLFGVFSGPRLHYTYPNGDDVSIVDVSFVCRSYRGEMKPDATEASDARFFSVDVLPDKVSPPVLPALERYVAQRLGERTELSDG